MKRALSLVAVVLLALASCGNDSPEMTPSAAAELESAVSDVRGAIEAGDMARARDLLTSLRTTVVALTTTGAITGDRALEINQAIDDLDEQVVQNTPTTTTTTRPATTTTTTTRPATTTSTSTTTTEKPSKGKGRDKDSSNGNDD